MTQTTLTFPRIEPTDERVKELIAILDGREWMTASEIVQYFASWTGVVWSDRLVRDLAAASDGRIAGSDRGYKLVRSMTREELDRACSRMNSQANKMVTRIQKMRAEFALREAAI